MKKLTIVAVMAIAAASITSCGGGAPKADLKSEVDTLSYAIGMANSEYAKHMVYNRYRIDSAYVSEFIKGVNEGVSAGDNKKKAAYYAGLQFGQEIASQWMPGINGQLFGSDSTKTISQSNLLAGLINGLNEQLDLMSPQEAQTVANELMERIMKRALDENIKAGQAFLAENAKKEGVQITESGLQYKVLKQGDGPVPSDTSKVKVNYVGKLIDGTEFDSSKKYGDDPVTFRANQVIKGWTEALTMMPVGSEWELYIPQELAYGERGSGDKIKPGAALVFTVELVGIE